MIKFCRSLFALCLPIAACAATAQPSCEHLSPWPEWEQAKAELIEDGSRVVDDSDPRRISTSEGQSYALFMALVNNDPRLFRSLLQWTDKHLAMGALDRQLPAWLWGRGASGHWEILDQNPAADADLWIAYTLLEAGRLWNEFEYTRLAHAMLRNVAEQEIAQLPGLGTMLLPAPKGFVHDGTWRLNPSYLPPQLATRLALEFSREPWTSLAGNTPTFLIGSSPEGIAPDWISWRDGEFVATQPDELEGSYNAIRVYLWVGMLAPEAPARDRLHAHFQGIEKFVDADGRVAEHIPTNGQAPAGLGPAGFSAALLPLLQDTATGLRLEQSLASRGSADLGYYNRMLWLFGKGWAERRYRFDADGQLIPAWMECS